jgi:hypothetical protein
MGQIAAQKQALGQNQYNFNRQRVADQQRPQILQQARGGDYAGAQNTAFANGDMDAIKFVSGLQETQRAQLGQHADAIAAVAANLAKLPADQRRAALAAAAPGLQRFGFTPDEIAAADVSDAGLTGYISAASSTKSALESYYDSQKPLTVADGAQVFGATPMGGGQRPLIAENVKDPPKPDYVLDTETGQWLLKPGTGSAGVPGAIPGYGAMAPSTGGGDLVSRMIPITLGSEGGGSLTNPKTSPKGARGPMQVMPGTNVSPGFGVAPAADNSEAERARVGRDYLAAMMERYNGDPAKAWAAYNAGPGRVDRLIAKNGDRWMFGLPQETQDYVQKNMAALGRNPAQPTASVSPTGLPTAIYARPPKRKDAPAGYEYGEDGKALRPIPGGPADPNTPTSRNVQSNRKAETDYRKEFEQRQDVKSFITARNQYYALRKTALNPNATAADDISSVYSFMKALDPQSVVREGEFATAQNATGVPDRMKNYYNQMLKGTRLNANQRQDMVNTAYRNYSVMRDNYNNVATQYRGYAQSAGVNPDNVARTYTIDEKKPNASRPQPKPGWKIVERK